MKGYISLIDEDESYPIAFDSYAEIYRIDDSSHRVIANTDYGEEPLGVADVTVSRKKGGEAPVELVTQSDGIEIHNHSNHNTLEVVSMVNGRTREVEKEEVTTVGRDSVVEVGHHTQLRLTVERKRPEPTSDHGERVTGPTRPSIAQQATKPEIAGETTILENIDEKLTVREDEAEAAAVSRDAIEKAETLVADCLPSGPAATALAKARTHHENEAYQRAIERATHVRDLAEREIAHLETVRDSDREEDTALENLKAYTTRYDLGVDVTTTYENLTGGTDATPAGQLQGDRPPESVPTAPDLALDYDTIEKGGRLGTGGTAEVFEVTIDIPDDEFTIALKEPRFEDDVEQAVIDEFEREADTWDRLDDHDNIVGVIDWGTAPLPWIAMEYMDGGTMTSVAGRISPRRSIWTLLEIVRGIYHAHQRGVAHLDLKPGNVLFRTTGAVTWPVPKVADWGLAKILLEHTRSVKGYTPLYAAPEQVDPERFGSTDTQTDIYQIGAVGYALVTGRPPFTGDASTVVYEILESDVPPPTEHTPGLPVRLDEILLQALEKDKTDRYENIVYLRDDLQELYDSL